MKVLFVYVDGGKGHYVPAVTMKTEFDRLGHETYLEEFFDLLDINWLKRINKFFWRTMLKMSWFENKVSKAADGDKDAMKLAIRYGIRHCTRVLQSYLEETPVEAIFTTHPYAGTVLSEMLERARISIPVYYFATDVFSAPVAAVSNSLRRFYISTEEGAEIVRRMGMQEDKVVLCPFPLQQNVAESPVYSKKEARRRIGLEEDLFTVQLNMGGEGLGSLTFLRELAKVDHPVQVVVIGGLNKRMTRRFNAIRHLLPENIHLVVAGFIKNVNEYLMASDIVVGRAGINTLLEAFYAHRPFLITELVYTVMQSADYVEKYHLGWNCNRDAEKQKAVILSCLERPGILEEMDRNFDGLPIEFSAGRFARMVEKDIEDYYRERG